MRARQSRRGRSRDAPPFEGRTPRPRSTGDDPAGFDSTIVQDKQYSPACRSPPPQNGRPPTAAGVHRSAEPPPHRLRTRRSCRLPGTSVSVVESNSVPPTGENRYANRRTAYSVHGLATARPTRHGPEDEVTRVSPGWGSDRRPARNAVVLSRSSSPRCWRHSCSDRVRVRTPGRRQDSAGRDSSR